MAAKTKKTEKKAIKKEGEKIAELKEQAQKLREEIFQLSLDNKQAKLKNTSSLATKKDELARLLTAIRIIELTNL